MKFLSISAAVAALLIAGFALTAIVSKRNTPNAGDPFSQWIAAQELKSAEFLELNISPKEPKNPGDPTPRAGIVVAALQKKDPDYYFHWVRDSAVVMRLIVQRAHARRLAEDRIHKQMQDFLSLSRDLQLLHSPYGMGEPRYTVEGKVDLLKWSRPQFDGPALRALAILEYLKSFKPTGNQKQLAEKVLRADLGFIRTIWARLGFDVWEELYAENYHTRLVQTAALIEGREYYKDAQHSPVSNLLLRELDSHWDGNKKYIRSQLKIEKTDGYTKKNTDLDSAVVLAVIEAGLTGGRHSVTDPRLQATVFALEKLFRETYPVNGNEALGLGYGRYEGDIYYGGNPWTLITAYYAQFYYRLAAAIAEEGGMRVTPANEEFVRSLLPEVSGHPHHSLLMTACMRKGDRILERIRSVTPADGQMYEQFDKVTGGPVGSRGIGWAHAAFIAAVLERERAAKLAGAAGVPNF